MTVWVDDPEPDPRADELEETCREAIKALREKDARTALKLLCEAVGDKAYKHEMEIEKELSDLLSKWRRTPEPRPGFLEFAHSKRRLSLT